MCERVVHTVLLWGAGAAGIFVADSCIFCSLSFFDVVLWPRPPPPAPARSAASRRQAASGPAPAPRRRRARAVCPRRRYAASRRGRRRRGPRGVAAAGRLARTCWVLLYRTYINRVCYPPAHPPPAPRSSVLSRVCSVFGRLQTRESLETHFTVARHITYKHTYHTYVSLHANTSHGGSHSHRSQLGGTRHSTPDAVISTGLETWLGIGIGSG